MSGEFLNLAGALSGDEFAELARSLLSELEGGYAPRGREAKKDESAPESARLKEAAKKIVKAAEKLVLTAEMSADGAGRHSASETGTKHLRLNSGDGKTESSNAGKTFSGASESVGAGGPFRCDVMLSGGGNMDLEKLSESIRRDARRCDSGFERY
ncbi:MAG: hypothetical protein EOM54_04170 [Clostridia bacterium]|nr:hypothetical protein [Clostridia bacterium]